MMTSPEWKSQFANDPRRDFELYLELIDGKEPQGRIERDADGELYLSLYDCPGVRIPFRWLMSLQERAESLPPPEADPALST
jgi:hypothetical protein